MQCTQIVRPYKDGSRNKSYAIRAFSVEYKNVLIACCAKITFDYTDLCNRCLANRAHIP